MSLATMNIESLYATNILVQVISIQALIKSVFQMLIFLGILALPLERLL